MTKTFENMNKFLLNRKNFAYLYFAKMLYVDVVLWLINYPAYKLLDDYVFTVICGTWLIYLFVHDILKKQEIIKSRYQALLALFCFISLVSFIVNFKAFGIVNVKTLILLFVMCFVIYPLKWYISENEIHNLIDTIGKNVIIVITVINIVSIVIYILLLLKKSLPFGFTEDMFLQGGHAISSRKRYNGLYSMSVIGSFFSYLTIFLALYFVSNKKINSIFAVIVIVSSAFFIVLSYCRSAYFILGIIIACICYRLICKKTNSKNAKKITITVFSILVFAVLILEYPKLMVIYHQCNNDYFLFFDVLTSGRLTLIRTIIRAIPSHLLLGYGWSNYEVLVPVEQTHPHNSLFAALLYSGIVAMLIYIVFLVVSFANMRRINAVNRNKGNYWLVIMTCCIFFESLFDQAIFGDVHFHIETGFFWLLVGYLVQDISFEQFTCKFHH